MLSNLIFFLEFAWVISRNKTLAPMKLQEVNTILQENQINVKSFIKTKHDPLTCWDTKNAGSIKNISILLLTFVVTLKYFI